MNSQKEEMIGRKIGERFEDSQTYLNLKMSMLEESVLYFKYKYFLTVAEFEGHEEVVNTLKQYLESSSDNVLGTLDYLRNSIDPSTQIPIGNTEKNLQSLIQSESYQAIELYPKMAEIARREGLSDIASWFDTLEKLKRIHVGKFNKI